MVRRGWSNGRRRGTGWKVLSLARNHHWKRAHIYQDRQKQKTPEQVMPFSPKPRPITKQEASRGRRSESLQPWYQTPTWKRLRAFVLERDHFLCQQCKREGQLTAVLKHATQDQSHMTGHVDHIKPHGGNWDLFVDVANLETLCKPCHSRKTIQEMRQR